MGSLQGLSGSLGEWNATTGLIGLVIFVADLWAIVTILKGKETAGLKALWCLLILVLPVLGLFIWYASGPEEMME
jgi:hypothetical protein